MTRRSAKQSIGEARNNENRSRNREFGDGDDCVMAFRAIATAQRADCHDNCDGEAESEMGELVPLFDDQMCRIQGRYITHP
jgi:hypothetical protein